MAQSRVSSLRRTAVRSPTNQDVTPFRAFHTGRRLHRLPSDVDAMSSATDIDANIDVGIHTRASLQRVFAHPGGPVYCSEPFPAGVAKQLPSCSALAEQPIIVRQTLLDDTEDGGGISEPSGQRLEEQLRSNCQATRIGPEEAIPVLLPSNPASPGCQSSRDTTAVNVEGVAKQLPRCLTEGKHPPVHLYKIQW